MKKMAEVYICDFCGVVKLETMQKCCVCKKDMCNVNMHARLVHMHHVETDGKKTFDGEFHYCHDCYKKWILEV